MSTRALAMAIPKNSDRTEKRQIFNSSSAKNLADTKPTSTQEGTQHRDLSFKQAMHLEQGHPRGHMLFLHAVSLCQSTIVIIIL